MSRWVILVAALLSAGNVAATAFCQDEQYNPSRPEPAAEGIAQGAERGAPKDQARIDALEKTLSGATLVGHFTDSSSPDAAPRAERYELAAVKHLGKGQWLFKARIRYGEHDITLPMTLPILWAGDTPIITVDKLPVVGMGTFNARVMIFQDHYAGIWSGGEHHGHIYGTVQPPKQTESRKQLDDEEAPKADSPKSKSQPEEEANDG